MAQRYDHDGLSSNNTPMNTPTFARNIAAADQFIDWLVASARFEDLRWQDDESGMWFQRKPSDELFDSAPAELAEAWADLNWAEQKYVIGSAADQLAEIETLSAEAEALVRDRI
jgi:hypothetical protein